MISCVISIYGQWVPCPPYICHAIDDAVCITNNQNNKRGFCVSVEPLMHRIGNHIIISGKKNNIYM